MAEIMELDCGCESVLPSMYRCRGAPSTSLVRPFSVGYLDASTALHSPPVHAVKRISKTNVDSVTQDKTERSSLASRHAPLTFQRALGNVGRSFTPDPTVSSPAAVAAVVAIAAIQSVVAISTAQFVVASETLHRVIPAPGIDHVGTLGTRDRLRAVAAEDRDWRP